MDWDMTMEVWSFTLFRQEMLRPCDNMVERLERSRQPGREYRIRVALLAIDLWNKDSIIFEV